MEYVDGLENVRETMYSRHHGFAIGFEPPAAVIAGGSSSSVRNGPLL